jgi:hypothetical protein
MDSEASLRGYSSPARARLQRARKAGLASGRKRRELAHPPVRRRMRQRELALKFPVKLVDRDEFDRREFERRLRLGIAPNARGEETTWLEYENCIRCFKAQGQGFLTTNGQRAEALAKRGRPRCDETIRRQHKILTELGLLRRFHDRRGGARAGNRDRLRVQFAPSYVTPPLAAPTTPASQACVGASSPDTGGYAARNHGPAPPGLSAPPDGGRPGNGKGSDKGDRDAPVAEAADNRLRESVESLARARALRAAEEGTDVSGPVPPLRGDGGRP